MKLGWKQVTLIISALATIVLLYILPTPNSNFRNIELEDTENLGVNEKIDKALSIIEKGAPMEGIKLLKEVEAEAPSNERVLFTLGDFSMKTAQYEKAIPRFERLVAIAPKSPQYWYLLAQSYEMNAQNVKAVEAYKTFVTFNTDEIIVGEVKKRIENLKK